MMGNSEMEAELMVAWEQLMILETNIRELATQRGTYYMQMMDHTGKMLMLDVVVGKAQILPALAACRKEREREEAKQKVVDWFANLDPESKEKE
jgi:hypothetical protein